MLHNDVYGSDERIERASTLRRFDPQRGLLFVDDVHASTMTTRTRKRTCCREKIHKLARHLPHARTSPKVKIALRQSRVESEMWSLGSLFSRKEQY